MVGDYNKDLQLMNKLYLIDFGISQKYQALDGSHLPFQRNVPFKGNILFSSKNAFDQISLSRRDDLISLMYFLIFCIKSNISWIDNTRPITE